jgi:hypothetical protein
MREPRDRLRNLFEPQFRQIERPRPLLRLAGDALLGDFPSVEIRGHVLPWRCVRLALIDALAAAGKGASARHTFAKLDIFFSERLRQPGLLQHLVRSVPTFRARDDHDTLPVRIDPFLVAAFGPDVFVQPARFRMRTISS